jgi:hypothetical protein
MSNKTRLFESYYIPNVHQMILISFFLVDVVRVLSYLAMKRRRVVPRAVRKIFFFSSSFSFSTTTMSLSTVVLGVVRQLCSFGLCRSILTQKKKKEETCAFFPPNRKKGRRSLMFAGHIHQTFKQCL